MLSFWNNGDPVETVIIHRKLYKDGKVIRVGSLDPDPDIDLYTHVFVEPPKLDTQKYSGGSHVLTNVITTTLAIVDKSAEELLADWETAMARSDYLLIPRWLEDHIESDHSRTSSNASLNNKYNEKKALRATKPE